MAKFVLAVVIVLAFVGAFLDEASANPYRGGIAGITQSEAEAVYNKVESAVKAHDGKALALLISKSHYRGISRQKIMIDFDGALSTCWQTLVLHTSFDDIFYNWRGMMLGRGAIWLNKEYSDSSCIKAGCAGEIRIQVINPVRDSWCHSIRKAH